MIKLLCIRTKMVFIKASSTKHSEPNIMSNTPPNTTAEADPLKHKVVPYTATMPSGFTIGKFPNPRSVVRPYLLGNNKEAQQFLSRGGQVIIRMRGLPYDATPKQVVSDTIIQ